MMNRLRHSLLTRFSLVSFAICALIALTFGWTLQGRLITDMLSNQAQESGTVVDALLWRHLTAQVLARPVTPAAKRNLAGLVAVVKQSENGVVRIKIWNTRGIVYYSDDPRIVGRRFPVDDDLAAALHGRTVANVSSVNQPENVDERRFGPQLLQTYVPIWQGPRHTGRVIGAYEIYHNMAMVEPKLHSIRKFVIFGVGGAFLVLYLSLFTIVRGASRQLSKQARENEAKADRLRIFNDLTRSISANSDLDSICGSALIGLERIVPGRRLAVAVKPAGHEICLHSAGSDVTEPGASALLERMRTVPAAVELAPCCDCPEDSESGCSCYSGGSYAVLPVRLRGQTMGFVAVGNMDASGGERLPEEQITALNELALQLAAAVDNAQLMDQAAEATALREVDRLKDEFISVVSHELRRPLSSIKGYAATLLLDNNWDEATRRDLIQVIDEESDRLSALVEDLLDLSRLGTGMLTLNREPVLLPRVAAAVCERVSAHPDLAPHTYTVAFADGLPPVDADSARISQVLVNLVENAAKYSPTGTTVTVSGRLLESGDQVEVTVADDGIGIASEDLEHVFDRFYRVDNSLSRRSQGTGLGLAICKGIVQAHGGRIRAESSGRGTAIRFTLPVSPVEAPYPDRVGAVTEGLPGAATRRRTV